jgi:hypothetical protein
MRARPVTLITTYELLCAAVAPGAEEAIVGAYPTQFHDATPAQLAAMFTYKLFARCNLYGDNLVTSSAYEKQQTRDNQWIAFQHHTHPCATTSAVHVE